jgi:hypothetical protein
MSYPPFLAQTAISTSASGSSSYDVTFEVPTAEVVVLTGSINASQEEPSVGFNESDSASVGLSGDGSAIYGNALNNTFFQGGDASEPISYTGVLSPGVSYELILNAQASGSANGEAPFNVSAGGNAGYDFSLTVVPEPTTLALFFGAMPLVLRRAGRGRRN